MSNLAGTKIATPTGLTFIENLGTGDEVYSYNEETGEREVSVIGRIDMFSRKEYFLINYVLRATRDHLFHTTDGVKRVSELEEGDVIYDENHSEVPVVDITRFAMVDEFTVHNLINVKPNNNYCAEGFLSHSKLG